jgi:putative DNA primase/helicase
MPIRGETVTEPETRPPDRDAIEKQLQDLPAIEQRGLLRQTAAHIAGLDELQRLDWRDWICDRGISKGEFDAIVKDHRRAAKRRNNEVISAQLVDRETQTEIVRARGTFLPAPRIPLAAARELVSRWKSTDGTPHITSWRGEWLKYTGTSWKNLDEGTITSRLYHETEHAEWVDDEGVVRPWAPNVVSIRSLQHALQFGALHRDADLEPDIGVYCRNGVIDVDSREIVPHHPVRFNLVSLPFDYDPTAQCVAWLAFLDAVFPGKPLSIAFLQEWFGYLISGDTKYQKIAVLIGPRRCGKGTIGRIVRKLMGGKENVVSPTLSDLASHFGLEQLIGKSLVLMGDVNWKVREAVEAAERIKTISGEDSIGVPRKNRVAWDGRLGVRFMLSSNDMPVIPDASGAAQTRLIPLLFEESFAGREDFDLDDKLDAEMTGILLWSLQGLTRLRAQGRFTLPEGFEELAQELERAGSPVAGFLQDRAEPLSTELRETAEPLDVDGVFRAYLEWCEKNGRIHRMEKNQFSAALRSAGNGLLRFKRVGRGKERHQAVFGLAELYPGSLEAPPQPQWLIDKQAA